MLSYTDGAEVVILRSSLNSDFTLSLCIDNRFQLVKTGVCGVFLVVVTSFSTTFSVKNRTMRRDRAKQNLLHSSK